MIDISKLKPEDIGKWVLYTDKYKTEEGKIKSWNDKYIFVVYRCADEWSRYKDYTAAATDPHHLTFIYTKE